MSSSLRRLEINSGRVLKGDTWLLRLDPAGAGYADAQLDDYGDLKRRDYLWRPGTTMDLRARFSHTSGELQGTAGFGFWNAPFGDPSISYPALPQATWYFYASSPSDLPFPERGAGRGWFVATIDAATLQAAAMAPLALPVVVFNNIGLLRRRIWPAVRDRLRISYHPLTASMTEWHHYRLDWRSNECRFHVDEVPIFETDSSPGGPLGFVCWIDNQYLVATPQGRLRWGTRPIRRSQWLEIADLNLRATADRF